MRTAQVVLGLFVLAVALGSFAFAADDKPACDVKTCKMVKWCGHCDAETDKAECCGKKAEMVEVCVKTVWMCEACEVTSDKQGKCECGSPMTKVEDKARTFYACPGCGTKADKGVICEACQKEVVKTCEKSGTKPHVAAAKKG